MAWIDEMLSGIPAIPALRERLTLAQEQRVAAEAQVAALQSDNESLRKEEAKLRGENESLQKRVRAFEEQAASQLGKRLPEIQEKLLLLLAKDWVNAPRVATSTGLNEHIVQHHLEELLALRMVELRGELEDDLGDQSWHLKSEGRKYLVTYNLLV